MLQTLKERVNIALGNICEAAAKGPHEVNYAGNLQFFTDVVTLLENRSERSSWLVEERSRALLGRAFSRVFSYLLDRVPHFYFDAAIAPMPIAVRGTLARWVVGKVDALDRAFASDDNGVAANEPGTERDAGGGGNVNDASDASEDAQEDAVSDMSD